MNERALVISKLETMPYYHLLEVEFLFLLFLMWLVMVLNQSDEVFKRVYHIPLSVWQVIHKLIKNLHPLQTNQFLLNKHESLILEKQHMWGRNQKSNILGLGRKSRAVVVTLESL